MSKKTNPQKFYEDLRKFQAKYPMCYLEAWTPEDFNYASALAEFPDEGFDESAVDWNDPDHEAVADRLSRHFDANIGTSWGRVRLELE
jgi:hypothetical protein